MKAQTVPDTRGLVPGIHVLKHKCTQRTWMAGTSPAMTDRELGVRTRRRERGCKRGSLHFGSSHKSEVMSKGMRQFGAVYQISH
jgi:hypothetical protein